MVVSEKELDELTLLTGSGPAFVYEFTKNLHVNAGVRNLFDKQLYREGNFDQAGANTYNEPGRSYYLGVTAKF